MCKLSVFFHSPFTRSSPCSYLIITIQRRCTSRHWTTATKLSTSPRQLHSTIAKLAMTYWTSASVLVMNPSSKQNAMPCRVPARLQLMTIHRLQQYSLTCLAHTRRRIQMLSMHTTHSHQTRFCHLLTQILHLYFHAHL